MHFGYLLFSKSSNYLFALLSHAPLLPPPFLYRLVLTIAESSPFSLAPITIIPYVPNPRCQIPRSSTPQPVEIKFAT